MTHSKEQPFLQHLKYSIYSTLFTLGLLLVISTSAFLAERVVASETAPQAADMSPDNSAKKCIKVFYSAPPGC